MTENRLIHLVDDDEAIRHSASFMLRHSGFRVKTYVDGVAFLEQVEEAEKGCILLDVQMPRMDGLQVQEALNERGVAKVTMGLCRGKKLHDKRESLRKADVQRDIARAMRRR